MAPGTEPGKDHHAGDDRTDRGGCADPRPGPDSSARPWACGTPGHGDAEHHEASAEKVAIIVANGAAAKATIKELIVAV